MPIRVIDRHKAQALIHDNPVEERECDMTQDQNEENKAIQEDEPDQFETPATAEDEETDEKLAEDQEQE